MKLIYRTALIAFAYDTGIVPTVTIDRNGTAVRINEDEYDAKTMKMFDAVDEPDPAEPPAPPVTDADPLELLVMKSGGKFFITDKLGTKIEGEQAEALGINDAGYTTEAKAQTALVGIVKQA